MLKKIYVSLYVLIFFVSYNSHAQRIIGYFPNYAYSAATYNKIQYQKLTHLNYFSLNPDETSSGAATSTGNLWFNDPYSWFTTARYYNVKTYAKSLSPKPRVNIVTGGSPGSDGQLNNRLTDIGSTPSKLNKFCNNIVRFIDTSGIDGWDLDWEFPNTAAQRTAHVNLVTKMRAKLDSLGTLRCKKYEISIAVGGGNTDVAAHTCWGVAHTDYLLQASITPLDFINIMTYDGNIGSGTGPPFPICSFPSHQDYNLMVKAYSDWTTDFVIPAAKVNLGVGFYNNAGTAFNSNGNNNTWYNQTYWPTGGSGCPNMQTKINYLKGNSNSGLIIWELLQDNLCVGTVPACYSLLDCIYQYTTTNWGTVSNYVCPAPVTYLSFDGKRSGENIYLNWATASELNNDYYSIERCTDGYSFSEIGRINGAGNSSQSKAYRYTDTYSGAEVLYYRLAQYDLDGTLHYSKVIKITASNMKAGILIQNNPFDDVLRIVAVGENIDKDASVNILDYSGKLLISKTIQKNEETALGSELASGLYFVQFVNNGEITNYKVIKQ